ESTGPGSGPHRRAGADGGAAHHGAGRRKETPTLSLGPEARRIRRCREVEPTTPIGIGESQGSSGPLENRRSTRMLGASASDFAAVEGEGIRSGPVESV